MSRSRWPVALSVRIYRRLLWIYPAGFRHDYGAPMVQLFQDCCRAVYTRHGDRGLGLLWLQTARDLAATSLRERRSAWRERNRSMTPSAWLGRLWP